MSATSQTTIHRRRIGFIIPLGLTLVLLSMGADWILPSVSVLEYLGIPGAWLVKAIYIIAPPCILAAWLVSHRSELVTGTAVFLAAIVVISATHWAQTRPVKVPITRWIDGGIPGGDLELLQARMGFKIWETGDSHGVELWVDRTPGRAQALINEVKRLGIYRP